MGTPPFAAMPPASTAFVSDFSLCASLAEYTGEVKMGQPLYFTGPSERLLNGQILAHGQYGTVAGAALAPNSLAMYFLGNGESRGPVIECLRSQLSFHPPPDSEAGGSAGS